MSGQLSDSFLRLVSIMEELREKCPWDKKQTIHTLRQQTIEETYELADAISVEEWPGIKEELGDLLLHIVFYARIGNEGNHFTLEDVITGVCNKLVSRHPHIYGDPKNGETVVVKDDEEVKMNWEKLKLKEGKKSVLSGVPPSLPSVLKAMRLQDKAKQVGFEWETPEQVWQKVEEEVGELKEAIASNIQPAIEDEFGDLLFSLINYARFLRLDADKALESTNKKFMSRFMKMEETAIKEGKDLHDMSLEEMDSIWNSIKRQQS